MKKYMMPNPWWPHDRIIAAILADQNETVSERLLSINNADRSNLERFFKRVLIIMVGGGHKDLAVAVFHPLKQEKDQPLEEYMALVQIIHAIAFPTRPELYSDMLWNKLVHTLYSKELLNRVACDPSLYPDEGLRRNWDYEYLKTRISLHEGQIETTRTARALVGIKTYSPGYTASAATATAAEPMDIGLTRRSRKKTGKPQRGRRSAPGRYGRKVHAVNGEEHESIEDDGHSADQSAGESDDQGQGDDCAFVGNVFIPEEILPEDQDWGIFQVKRRPPLCWDCRREGHLRGDKVCKNPLTPEEREAKKREYLAKKRKSGKGSATIHAVQEVTVDAESESSSNEEDGFNNFILHITDDNENDASDSESSSDHDSVIIISDFESTEQGTSPKADEENLADEDIQLHEEPENAPPARQFEEEVRQKR